MAEGNEAETANQSEAQGGEDNNIVTSNAAQGTAGQEDLEEQLKQLKRELGKTKREAAERRVALEAFEKAEEERKQAEMTELEKLQTRLEQMESRAKEAEAKRDLLVKRQQFYTAISAANLQFANEQARQDAVLLVDLSEMDGEDIGDIVKELKKARPYLFATATAPDIDGQRRGGTTRGGEMEEILQAASAKYGFTYVTPD
jgi:hypothetical protein